LRFPFTSLLTPGLVGTSFAVSFPFFDRFLGDLLSESSEISLEEGSRTSDYIVKPHHSLSYLRPRVQSGSFPLLLTTFRLFFAGSPSLPPDDKSITCATTEPQRERRQKPGHSDERSSGASLTSFHPARLRLKRRSSSSSEFILAAQGSRRRSRRAERDRDQVSTEQINFVPRF